jgi:hypothetical protein
VDTYFDMIAGPGIPVMITPDKFMKPSNDRHRRFQVCLYVVANCIRGENVLSDGFKFLSESEGGGTEMESHCNTSISETKLEIFYKIRSSSS